MSNGNRLVGSPTPRVFTPPKRELTRETSLGFQLIDFAEQVLEIKLLPWQKFLAIHGLELEENGLPRFQVVVCEVARQQGKTEFSKILALFHLYLLNSNLVVGTAQDVSIAKEIWASACSVVQDIPDLAAEMARQPRTTNGQIELCLTGNRKYVVKAPTSGGARGLSADLVIMDELRQQKDWQGWAALTATTLARPKAQVWAFSNAGDSGSLVLRHLRMQAHKALGDPDGVCSALDPTLLLDGSIEEDEASSNSLGWFEWSAPPTADLMDPEGWKWAAPSLGHGFVTERSLRGKIENATYAVAKMEYLCQWIDGDADGPFPPGKWDAGRVDEADDSTQLVGDFDAAVEVSWDRTKACIVYGGRRADGLPQVEVAAYRGSSDWVVDWFTSPDRTVLPKRILIRTSSPAETIREDLERDGFTTEALSQTEYPIACGALWDAVTGGEGEPCGPFRHLAHTALDVAAGTAKQRAYGSGTWAWDFRDSPTDIGPLVAATGLLWLIQRPAAPFRSRYEDEDIQLMYI